MRALIFANGKPKDGGMVRDTLATASDATIIAADGGARVAYYYRLKVQTVIGDMDSLTTDEIVQQEERGVEVLRYPPEKDKTDLELALLLAAERGARWIRIIGGMGGRFDQMLANVHLLALPELENCDVALVAGDQSVYLLRPGTHTIKGTLGDTVSLIPIGGTVSGITTENLKYALNDEPLYFGPARGVSNLMMGDHALISIKTGNLLAVHTRGRA